jgi:hypothetical protein
MIKKCAKVTLFFLNLVRERCFITQCKQSGKLVGLGLAGRLNCPLARLFLNHFRRTLIFPDSKKNRLSETVIPRPLREFYLTDHHRLDPVAPLHFGGGQSLVPTVSASRRNIEKRPVCNANFIEISGQRTQKLVIEPGADSLGKFEFLTFAPGEVAYCTFTMPGGSQVPSPAGRTDGGSVFGQ